MSGLYYRYYTMSFVQYCASLLLWHFRLRNGLLPSSVAGTVNIKFKG